MCAFQNGFLQQGVHLLLFEHTQLAGLWVSLGLAEVHTALDLNINNVRIRPQGEIKLETSTSRPFLRRVTRCFTVKPVDASMVKMATRQSWVRQSYTNAWSSDQIRWLTMRGVDSVEGGYL